MDGLRCKRCGGWDHARSGMVRGHQRYRCRACGCHFTGTPLRGKPPAMKALAVLLYGMGGMSFRMIGRVLGVSDVAVLKWVRAEASTLPEPEVGSSVLTVEIDEMWHFIKKVCQTLGLACL
ncbi:MAG: IS1/IS1595 family N-terminal zinc-binding domain-containing protein [Janthinobacterium lividum]